MKIFKSIVIICLLIVFYGCSLNDHKAKESVNLKNYRGAIIIGKQFDWSSEQNGAELTSFQKGDSVWVESYMKCVWEKYNIGDTIK